VHHVSINVDDVDKALDFYVGTLGLVPRRDRPDFGFPGAWLNAGDQQVHLIGGQPPANLGQHFALQVDDIDKAIRDLRERGVEVTDAIPVATNFQAFLSDPAGNNIELHQVGGVSGSRRGGRRTTRPATKSST
jgi:catechol 2,3-dioxygenase-like lactoylglutathione lyase family enzyme